MKKTFLIATVLLSSLLISCNSDDDNEDIDPFIGEWTRTEFTSNILIDGKEGPTTVEDHKDCEGNDYILIVEEYGVFKISKSENRNTGKCLVVYSTWENIGDGIYEISSDDTSYTMTPKFSEKSFKVEVVGLGMGNLEEDVFIYRTTYTKE